MNIPYDDARTRKFVTNAGLITSDGPNGQNIMTAEWTHHVSYGPCYIAVCINPNDATVENIRESKEFGVNLAADNQNIVASIAGGSSGRDVDKIAILRELGIKFYKAEKIKAVMVKGAAMNAECKVIQEIPLGDHIMFVGEVLVISADDGAMPLAYHNGKYWKLPEKNIPKPEPDMIDEIAKLTEKFKKSVRA